VQPAPLGAPPLLGGAQESVKGPEGGLWDSRDGTKIGRDGTITVETTAGLILREGKRQMTADRKRGTAVMGNCRQPTFSAQPDVAIRPRYRPDISFEMRP